MTEAIEVDNDKQRWEHLAKEVERTGQLARLPFLDSDAFSGTRSVGIYFGQMSVEQCQSYRRQNVEDERAYLEYLSGIVPGNERR